jgi:hypothetical protein
MTLHFRNSAALVPSGATRIETLDQVRQAVQETLRSQHFFLGGTATLEWQHLPREETAWEIFRGRLLDPAHTRQRLVFEAWNVHWVEEGRSSTEPILSIKLQHDSGQLHVVRAVHSWVWEGYDAGAGVILSREVPRWVRELVGSIELKRFSTQLKLLDELICQLFLAVVGNSRLPLTSLEAPLPAFSLGLFGYIPPNLSEKGTGLGVPSPFRSSSHAANRSDSAGPLDSGSALIQAGLHPSLSWLEQAKLMELLVRAIPAAEVARAAEAFWQGWRALGHTQQELLALCHTLFNEIALSPYTDFVDKFLAALQAWLSRGYVSLEDYANFLSYLLRQLGRHLTAYDLVTFHHRGANYPDALLLDTVLRAFLQLCANEPGLFLSSAGDTPAQQDAKRLRRRALRQGWLLRRSYEGLPVPDAPTSPGENARVWPAPFERVPEEQILVPARRTKRLYAESALPPLGPGEQQVLRQAIADLEHPEELRELGTALYLDRPLGWAKAPGEPDQTLLFSYEVFSRSIAERRLQWSCAKRGRDCLNFQESRPLFAQALSTAAPAESLPLQLAGTMPRPGTVSLADMARVANDFVLLRTTRQTVTAFLEQFDFGPLAARTDLSWLAPSKRVLLIQGAFLKPAQPGMLVIYDAQGQRRLELQIDTTAGYARRAGQEFPIAGLRINWLGPDQQAALSEQDLRILPRAD